MKTIRIKYVGFDPRFMYERTVLYQTLTRYYNVELSDNPDYIICGVYGEPYDYCLYPQVRIMDCWENYIPDFNLVDYAISSYPLSFQDRHMYAPGCVFLDSAIAGRFAALQKKDRNYTAEILRQKPYFANFMANHESEHGLRGAFFNRLSEYKRIESVGHYLNNAEQQPKITWRDESKSGFQKKCKFSLCFESTAHPGFITEKLADAFYADTIPVYYGSPDASDIFNKDAFIDCSDGDFDAAIRKIIELDSDDEKYLSMLRQPVLNDPGYYDKLKARYDEFIRHIFDQSPEEAYRRSRIYWPRKFDNYLSSALQNPVKDTSIPMKRLLKAVYRKTVNKLTGRR